MPLHDGMTALEPSDLEMYSPSWAPSHQTIMVSPHIGEESVGVRESLTRAAQEVSARFDQQLPRFPKATVILLLATVMSIRTMTRPRWGDSTIWPVEQFVEHGVLELEPICHPLLLSQLAQKEPCLTMRFKMMTWQNLQRATRQSSVRL